MDNKTVERYKAHLVANGFTQTEGIDYPKTFSLVVKMTTIILLLSLYTSDNWYIHPLDINTIFLHGNLDEEVYMKVHVGLQVFGRNMVCKL